MSDCINCNNTGWVLVVDYDNEGNPIERKEPCSCKDRKEQPRRKIDKSDPFGFEDNERWLINNLLLILVFCCLSFSLNAQVFQKYPEPNKPNVRLGLSLKRAALPAFLGFTGGVSAATKEALLWRREGFFARFPGANRQYWDNRLSWENKYTRPSFVPVQFTDGYHLMEATKMVSVYGSAGLVGINLIRNKHESRAQQVLDFFVAAALNSALYLASSELVFSKFYSR